MPRPIGQIIHEVIEKLARETSRLNQKKNPLQYEKGQQNGMEYAIRLLEQVDTTE